MVMLQNRLLAQILVLLFKPTAQLFVLGQRGPQRLVRPLSLECVGKDLSDQLQSGDDFLGPLAAPLQECEGDRTQDQPPALSGIATLDWMPCSLQ